ncbi:MAG: flavodoxin family protein, partial [Spirochaetes bacterium]|nr:flavodoxin family protein [Spirochaetota bacterium]
MGRKRILGIKVSGRIKSNTEIILNELLRPAKEKGYDIEIISLIRYNLKHCTGCFGCNNGELKCVIKDDLEIIKG